jgi:hypothetical protein
VADLADDHNDLPIWIPAFAGMTKVGARESILRKREKGRRWSPTGALFEPHLQIANYAAWGSAAFA